MDLFARLLPSLAGCETPTYTSHWMRRHVMLELHHQRQSRTTVYVKVPKEWKDILFLIIGYQSDRCFPSFVRSIEG